MARYGSRALEPEISHMNPDTSFWQSMTQLVKANSLVIDRPRGSTHLRYPQVIYPLDYGYLENTTSSDGGGIDVWVGSLNALMDTDERKTLTGILCTFDRLKRDAEIKLLVACSAEDIQIIRDFHKEMHTLYIPNPAAEYELSN
jgi:inorganic pyrophosphatase